MSFSFSFSFSSSSKGVRRNLPHDITTKSGLTSLYNQPVVRAERVKRPLAGLLGKVGIKHSGVRVTTEDGGQWLIHKGGGYGGTAGDTVVTNSRHMRNQWKTTGETNTVQGATVSDFVMSGGTNYNVALDNCHHASKRMMKNK